MKNAQRLFDVCAVLIASDVRLKASMNEQLPPLVCKEVEEVGLVTLGHKALPILVVNFEDSPFPPFS